MPVPAAPGYPYLPAALVAACLVAFVVAWLRGWTASLATAVGVTLATRAAMVAAGYGHTPNDVTRYFYNAGRLIEQGRDPLTQLRAFQWNFLPLMPYVFAAEQQLGISWQVASKIAPVLGDVAVTVLLARLATGPDTRRVPLLWALCPLPVLVSALHGQVEPVALALGLGALLLARRHRTVAAGLLGGLAVASKTWPVILVLGVLRETPPRRWWRLLPALAAGPLLLLLSIPAFLHDSLADAVDVLTSYRSLVGQWGWTGILRFYGHAETGYQGPGIDGWQTLGTVLTATVLVAALAAFWRAGAVVLTAGITLGFLVVTAGFGVQYLLWPVPFVLLLHRRTGLLFLTVASVYGTYVYWLVSPPGPGRDPEFPFTSVQLWGSLPVIAAALVAIPWDRVGRRQEEPVPGPAPEPVPAA